MAEFDKKSCQYKIRIMQARTKRQREVLEYLTDFIDRKGYEPSYQQIARDLNIRSKSAIAKHISALEKQGLVTRVRTDGSFRLYINALHSTSESVCEIPWLNLPNYETNEEPLLISKQMLDENLRGNLCAFRIKDNSMIDEMMLEDDIAIIEKRSFARDRDCIAALVKDEYVILRKYYRRGAKIELRAANENFESIILSANKIKILGFLRGLLRLPV